MGCSLSCSLFEQFSSSLQEALILKFGFSLLSHILDDFIFIAPKGSPLCRQQLAIFLSITAYVGIPIKESKTILPSSLVPIHGILVDMICMEAHLPEDKHLHLLDLVSSFSKKRSAKLRLWQSLLGHLSFACRVIRPGCPFLRRMFNILRGHTNPNHFIRIPSHVHADCEVWKLFLQHFNGISILTPPEPLDSRRIHLFSDASAWGCGAIFGSRWFQLCWNSVWGCKHINVKEFLPICLALDVWGNQFRNCALTFHSDNLSVVEVINAGTTRDLDMLKILRFITLLALRLQIQICAIHVPGRLNVIADKLSRTQATLEFLVANSLYEVATPLRQSTLTSMQL